IARASPRGQAAACLNFRSLEEAVRSRRVAACFCPAAGVSRLLAGEVRPAPAPFNLIRGNVGAAPKQLSR
ncbi:hypothetical protein DUP91_27225, partial [Salmonella enterica subsp. enterica]|nr:hypothetical protein [Salmonella enterica subsp. enterica]